MILHSLPYLCLPHSSKPVLIENAALLRMSNGHATSAADLLGDLIVPVDRIEVTGDAGIVHQIAAGQFDDLLRQLVADLDRTELTQCHR